MGEWDRRGRADLRRHRRPKIRSGRIRASVYRIRSGFPCADTRVTLCVHLSRTCAPQPAYATPHVISIPDLSSLPFSSLFELCLSFASLSTRRHSQSARLLARTRTRAHLLLNAPLIYTGMVPVPRYTHLYSSWRNDIAEPPSFNFPDLSIDARLSRRVPYINERESASNYICISYELRDVTRIKAPAFEFYHVDTISRRVSLVMSFCYSSKKRNIDDDVLYDLYAVLSSYQASLTIPQIDPILSQR